MLCLQIHTSVVPWKTFHQHFTLVPSLVFSCACIEVFYRDRFNRNFAHCQSGITARVFCWNRKATLRNKANQDSQKNTHWNCVCLYLNFLFGGSSVFTYNTMQVPTKVSSTLVLLNFWRNHLVLCLENLLPSPLCWREKPCFHPCMLKTSSKSIPAYYCASNYRLRVHKIFTTFLLLSITICHKLCFGEESGWSLQICSNYSIWMSQCVENSSSQLILLSCKLFSVVSTLFIP